MQATKHLPRLPVSSVVFSVFVLVTPSPRLERWKVLVDLASSHSVSMLQLLARTFSNLLLVHSIKSVMILDLYVHHCIF